MARQLCESLNGGKLDKYGRLLADMLLMIAGVTSARSLSRRGMQSNTMAVRRNMCGLNEDQDRDRHG